MAMDEAQESCQGSKILSLSLEKDPFREGWWMFGGMNSSLHWQGAKWIF